MRVRLVGNLRSEPTFVVSSLLKSFVFATLYLLAFVISSSQPGHAIPSFARKYGLPCSACHEAWPKLNSFGQQFKDTGYQLMNDRDSPVWRHD